MMVMVTVMVMMMMVVMMVMMAKIFRFFLTPLVGSNSLHPSTFPGQSTVSVFFSLKKLELFNFCEHLPIKMPHNNDNDGASDPIARLTMTPWRK